MNVQMLRDLLLPFRGDVEVWLDTNPQGTYDHLGSVSSGKYAALPAVVLHGVRADAQSDSR